MKIKQESLGQFLRDNEVNFKEPQSGHLGERGYLVTADTLIKRDNEFDLGISDIFEIDYSTFTSGAPALNLIETHEWELIEFDDISFSLELVKVTVEVLPLDYQGKVIIPGVAMKVK